MFISVPACLLPSPEVRQPFKRFQKALRSASSFKICLWCHSLSPRVKVFSGLSHVRLGLPSAHFCSGFDTALNTFNLIFLTVIMMSWFCSRVIFFSSVLLVMTLATSTGHLDVIKYLSSPGASWEGRDLGRSHSFSGLQGEDKVLLVPGDWWCWNGSASSLHFAGKAASPQMWAGFFYPHVNPALIHS